jgi:autotransporter-associated beta strand protein
MHDGWAIQGSGRAVGVWCVCALVGLSLAPQASGLPDFLSVAATNTVTRAPVTFALERYNLRSSNYQVRIYSDATNYTLLPASQMPEVATYRGRIPSDPGAMVVGSFDPSGQFIYFVSYGSRHTGSGSMDPYDTTNRVQWGSWGASVATTNVPAVGTYSWSWRTNMPLPIAGSTNYFPADLASHFGGPAILNNLQRVPAQRVRMIQDMSRECFISSCGSNISYAVMMQESRVNEMDYIEARDFGICYQVVLVCIRPSTEAPFTSGGNGRLGDLRAYWQADPGWAGDSGQNANSWFDMAQGTMNLGGGVAYAPGCFAITDPGFNGNVEAHEVGHNWGAIDVTSLWDYTGENSWYWTQTGSGYGHSTEMAVRALGIRRNGEYYKSAKNMEWVKYNSPVAPWATPDFATTRTNQPVSLSVLLNDHCASSNAIAVASFETNTPAGGVVTDLGGGVLRYTPPAGFTGYDWFHYYVGEGTGLKSLSEAHVKVVSADDPLLARWTFDQTNGTVLAEATGRGVAGALLGTANFGAGAAAGINGSGGLHLDGGGYVQFPGRWFDPLDSSWTLSLWCRPDATPASDQVLFSKTDRSGAAGLFLAMNGSSFYLNGAVFGGTPGFSVSAAVTPAPGQWYHVVAEVDRSNQLARLWVNGVEYTGTFNTRSIPASEFVFGEAPPALGACPRRGYYLKGTLDDVQLFGRALAQAEVAALYLGGGMLPAGGPDPVDGARDVALSPRLAWAPGRTNYQHDVYLATNRNAVLNATTASPEYKGRQSAVGYTPPSTLAPLTSYYWRIDEVSGTNKVAGAVWGFTTAVDAWHGDLRLHYSFDAAHTDGATARDLAGPTFDDGTLMNGAAAVTGPVREALDFDGTNDYVAVGNPAALNFAGRITITAWVRSRATDGLRNIVEHGYRTGPNQEVGLRISGGNYQILSWDGADHTLSYAIPPGDLNAWVHLVGTYDGSVWHLFRNGVEVARRTDALGSILVSDNWAVGARGTGTERFFQGSIDEVAIWSRALSSNEVYSLYTNGVAGQSFDQVAQPPPGTFTWTGLSDASWTNAGNWAAGSAPGAADEAVFDPSSIKNTATDLGADQSVLKLTVKPRTRSIDIGSAGNNTLALGAGGIDMAAEMETLTLNARTALGWQQTWSVASNATLAVGTLGNNGYALTLDAQGAVNLNGVVSGAGGLVKNGSGTVTINNWNGYSGNTVVNGGTLVLARGSWYNGSDLGSSWLIINTGAVVRTAATHVFDYGGNNPIRIYEGTLTFGQESYVSANFEITGGRFDGTGGDARIWGPPTIRASAIASVIAMPLNLVNGGTYTFNVENGAADPDLEIAAGIMGGASVAKAGAGTMLVTAACSYSGNTTVQQGTLRLGSGVNRLPAGTTLTVNNGTTFHLALADQALAGLAGSGAISLIGGTLEINPSGRSLFGGVISGNPAGVEPPQGDTIVPSTPGGITVDGAGRLALTNANTYSGDTMVHAGALELFGAGSIAASSNIFLQSAGALDVTNRTGGFVVLGALQTLRGFGTVRGRLTSGGIVAPGIGYSQGALVVSGSYTQQAGGTLSIDIGGAGSADRLAVAGPATLGGLLAVSLTNGFEPFVGDAFAILGRASGGGAFASTNLPVLPNDRMWQVVYSATGVVLGVVANGDPIYVSVTAGDASAGETLLDPGTFLFTRSGPTGDPVTVRFTVGGSAAGGVDYASIGTSVVIPAGQTNAAVTIAPMDDLLTEGEESVTVAIDVGFSYVVVPPATAAVVIADNDYPPAVAITSPTTNSAGIPAGVGLVLEATVTDDGTPDPPGVVTAAWTKVSGPGTVTFGNPAWTNTTALFSTNGTYLLRLTAGDGNQTASRDLAVSVGGAPGTDSAWTTAVVGAVNPPPGYSLTGGTHRITAAGDASIYSASTTDDFFFVMRRITGNCEITARVVSVQNVAGTYSRAGVMIRESTAPGARSAFSGMRSTGNRYFIYRSATNAGNVSASSNGTTLPYWVRLVRTGNVFRAYRSSNGASWTQTGSDATIAMSNTAWVGLAAASGLDGSSGLAVIDSVGITPATVPAGNVGPLVDAGANQAVLLPGGASMQGTATDDGKPSPPARLTYLWQEAAGPGVAGFGNATSLITTASFDAAGSYVLRLIAHDGEVKTFDDTVITAGAPTSTVTLAAVDANAAEPGADTGAFLFTRDGALFGSLTIGYSVAGSATADLDYTNLGTSVVIPAGESTVEVLVRPAGDSLSEGAESVTIEIAADPAYTIGLAASDTVWIADTPIDEWRHGKFGAEANGESAADGADPDGDGYDNLAEYGLGGEPLTNAILSTPTLQLNDGDALFGYRRSATAEGISFQVIEAYELPGAWSNAVVTGGTTNAVGADELQVEEVIPTADADRKFIGLRITRP